MEEATMAKRVRRTWPLVLIGVVALVLIGGIVALQPNITLLTWVVRTCALLGYLSVFLAVLSSAYMRQLVRTFGRPFVQTHHILSVTGLILITLHPLAVAWNFGSPGVFVPRFNSLTIFLQWGGPVAWYLVGIASLAALLRASLRQQWRAIHWLNYLAFLLATAHAILIGTDLRSIIVKILAILMALAVVGTFVHKQLQRRRLRAKRAQRSGKGSASG
jgi:DMSO/TMAO reductase YedYZ heme-binding membrane subunit